MSRSSSVENQGCQRLPDPRLRRSGSDNLDQAKTGRFAPESTRRIRPKRTGRFAPKPTGRFQPNFAHIAEIFFKAGFIETWGRGIDKILTSCAQSGLAEPTFEEWAGGVQVTFFRKVTTQVTTQVEAVVKVLEHGETISARELMERLGLANREHFREAYLDAALKAGLIERTLPNKPNSRLQKYRRCGGVA